MVDDRLADADSSGDAGRTKREGPTIDLEASEVSSETKPAPPTEPAHEAASDPEPPKAATPESVPRARPMSPWLIAPLSGAVAAALVIAVGWMLGWLQVQAPPPASAPQVTAAAVDDLSGRIAALETKVSKPNPTEAVVPGSFLKPVKDLRDEVTALHAQSDKLAGTVNELKSAPRDATGNIDLTALNERIDQLETASRMQGDAIATGKAAANKPADDKPLRLVVAAALLDVAVRHGDPFAAELAAAKSLSPNADALKPLDGFAATGVPSPPLLCRELLALVPKLAPSAPASTTTTTTGTGIIDRLKAGATKLVKVERTDSIGSDRGAVVARVTAAALRNDIAETRRELDSLDPADRAAAQGWLDKVRARDAALAASRQFAEQSMASLANQAQ
jgi:hypothetical protein